MKRSAKELKELKGDSKLPGYPGEFTDLHTDQIVKVTHRQEERNARSPQAPSRRKRTPTPSGETAGDEPDRNRRRAPAK